MFTAVTDSNTTIVYEWVEDKTGDRTLVPSSNWKPKQEWTHDEIIDLFISREEVIEDDDSLSELQSVS